MNKKRPTVPAQEPRWECIDSKEYNKRYHYGRFILVPLMEGQADTIAIAMRRALLGEIKGTCITGAKFENVSNEFSTIAGVKELVFDIVKNLNNIVLRSNLYGRCQGSIFVEGPRDVTAQDIRLPPYIEIVDNTQHIARLTEPINLFIQLQIERHRGFSPYNNRIPEGYYSSTALAVPVLNVNYNVHSYRNGNESQEILFLEIWTNGSLTPKEALREAAKKLMSLFISFSLSDIWDEMRTRKTKIDSKEIFLDQLGLSDYIYNRLKGADISTLFDLVNKSQKDIRKIFDFSLKEMLEIVFSIEIYFQFIERNFEIY
nr:RNA polymerase alpha subunit [Lundia spruceana]